MPDRFHPATTRTNAPSTVAQETSTRTGRDLTQISAAVQVLNETFGSERWMTVWREDLSMLNEEFATLVSRTIKNDDRFRVTAEIVKAEAAYEASSNDPQKKAALLGAIPGIQQAVINRVEELMRTLDGTFRVRVPASGRT